MGFDGHSCFHAFFSSHARGLTTARVDDGCRENAARVSETRRPRTWVSDGSSFRASLLHPPALLWIRGGRGDDDGCARARVWIELTLAAGTFVRFIVSDVASR